MEIDRDLRIEGYMFIDMIFLTSLALLYFRGIEGIF